MNEEKLKEIEKRAHRATDGLLDVLFGGALLSWCIFTEECEPLGEMHSQYDAVLWAHAKRDVTVLLAAVREQEAIIAALREELAQKDKALHEQSREVHQCPVCGGGGR